MRLYRWVLGEGNDRRPERRRGPGRRRRVLARRRLAWGREEPEPPRRLRPLGERRRCGFARRALRLRRSLTADAIRVPGLHGLNRRRRGGRGGAPRPVDGVEIEPGRVVDLDAPVLEAVHGVEDQQPDLSQERLGQALSDEHDARRPAAGAASIRHEAPHGFRIFERPRVGLDHPEKHRVVAREAERDKRRRPTSVHADDLDHRAAEIDSRGDDAEPRLDCLSVFGDKGLELGQILDIVLPECKLHPQKSRATDVPPAVGHFDSPN